MGWGRAAVRGGNLDLRANWEWELVALPTIDLCSYEGERRASNAFFCTRTRAVVLKHCLKVDRTLDKLLIATKVNVIFF